MKLTSIAFLAATTVANFFLAESLHNQASRVLLLLLLLFGAAQGLCFVGLVHGATGFNMARATVIYDVVVVVCWYGMVLWRGEGLGLVGVVGLLMVAVGVLLVFK